jgi:hypothetical protein
MLHPQGSGATELFWKRASLCLFGRDNRLCLSGLALAPRPGVATANIDRCQPACLHACSGPGVKCRSLLSRRAAQHSGTAHIAYWTRLPTVIPTVLIKITSHTTCHLAIHWFLTGILFSIMKKEAIFSSETSDDFQRTTLYSTPRNRAL